MIIKRTYSRENALYYIMFLFFIVPLIPIEGLYYINNTLYNLVFVYCAFLDALCIFFYWVVRIKRGASIGSATIVFMVMGLYNIVLTIIKHGDLRSALAVWMFTIMALILIDTSQKRIDILLKAVLFYLEFLLVINLLFILIRPNGLYAGNYSQYGKIWLLGYKSSLQCYAFPAIIISLLFSAYGKYYKNTLFLLLISHVICIAESNGMLLIGLLLIDIIILSKLYKKNIITRNILIISIAIIIFANIVVVLYTDKFLSNSFVQYLTFTVLGKNSTLSMRTSNWAAVLKAIKRNPVLGYGFTTQEVRTIMYGRETAHAHNLFLELLYEGGIIELILFLVFNMIIIKKLYQNFKKNSSKVVFFALFVFYIMYIFENVFQKSSAFIWAIFILGYNTASIDKKLTETLWVSERNRKSSCCAGKVRV